MTEDEMKAWIDKATYQDLLYKARFEPIGSPWFTGSVADHFEAVMARRRTEVGAAGHTAASKAIGWG